MMPQPPPRKPDYLAAFLSYLLPGLGQVIQGRVAKGLLYFVCLYGLFFYGMWLGQWKNVWLPDCAQLADVRLPILGVQLPNTLRDVSYRKEFAGQFWMGIAVWPAIVQYHTTEVIDQRLQLDEKPENRTRPTPNSVLGRYMQAPIEADLNDLQRNGENKRWDLGWVYTVIAGVLNILVIYDAFAGPVIKDDEEFGSEKAAEPSASGGTP